MLAYSAPSGLFRIDPEGAEYIFPPLKEQERIVGEIENVLAETQKLEAVYQKKLDDLEELKKSILQKAFAGELRSPEGATYLNDGCSPSDKKRKTIKSPERAEFISVAVSPLAIFAIKTKT